MWETEGLIDTMRTIAGGEISALLKEDERSKIKISLRAKSYGEVLTIANAFQGGGHKMAAGGTIHKTMEEAKTLVRNAVEQWFEAYDVQK